MLRHLYDPKQLTLKCLLSRNSHNSNKLDIKLWRNLIWKSKFDSKNNQTRKTIVYENDQRPRQGFKQEKNIVQSFIDLQGTIYLVRWCD